MTRVRGVLVAVALCLAGTVDAQTVCDTNCVVTANRPVEVLTDADPASATYRLTMNGSTVPMLWTMANGVVTFAFATGLLPGAYTFQIAALDKWLSEPNTLLVLDAPGPAPIPSYRCTVAQQPKKLKSGTQYALTCDPALVLQRGATVTVTP